MAKVSVIIPTFNRADLLPRAVASVRAQTYRDFEILVVDDGSTDATAALEAKWTDVTFIRSDNCGVSHARNLGAQHASGEWLAFLDSDDEWLPRKLELQMPLTEKYSVIHGQELWRNRGLPVPQKKKHFKSGGRVFNRAAEICFVAPSTVLIRRDLYLANGGFREDFPVCEDYEFWLRLSSRFDFGFVGDPILIRHAGHGDQLSRKYRAMDYFRVKALAPFLGSPDLSGDERNHAALQLLCKSEILLRGYEKYGNRESSEEIQGFAAAARKFLTQNLSPHSADAFFPRSMDNLT